MIHPRRESAIRSLFVCKGVITRAIAVPRAAVCVLFLVEPVLVETSVPSPIVASVIGAGARGKLLPTRVRIRALVTADTRGGMLVHGRSKGPVRRNVIHIGLDPRTNLLCLP